MLVLILGVGFYLTLGLRFLTIIRIPFGFRLLWRGRVSRGRGEISPFGALMTSLSATIGTGNIAGVATAIYLGGPGLSSGCGLLHSLGWRRSMLKRYVLSDIANKMSGENLLAGLCTTLRMA
jgi:hypothetical protein